MARKTFCWGFMLISHLIFRSPWMIDIITTVLFMRNWGSQRFKNYHKSEESMAIQGHQARKLIQWHTGQLSPSYLLLNPLFPSHFGSQVKLPLPSLVTITFALSIPFPPPLSLLIRKIRIIILRSWWVLGRIDNGRPHAIPSRTNKQLAAITTKTES